MTTSSASAIVVVSILEKEITSRLGEEDIILGVILIYKTFIIYLVPKEPVVS